MPNQVSLPLSLTCALGFFYIITMYSAVGRVLMYSGAIGDERILEEDEGEIHAQTRGGDTDTSSGEIQRQNKGEIWIQCKGGDTARAKEDIHIRNKGLDTDTERGRDTGTKRGGDTSTERGGDTGIERG